MEKYSENTIGIVNKIMEIADVRGLVEHAMKYACAYKDEVVEYVLTISKIAKSYMMMSANTLQRE